MASSDTRSSEITASSSGSAVVANPRWHYAWVVSALTFVVLLTAAGVRTAPGVFIKPLELEFGWSRATISLAVAVSLFAFGFGGPIAGYLIDRFGPRWVMVGGLMLIVVGLGPLLWLRALWQLYLFWGLITGIGTGMIATVMGATVANRWFKNYRGLMVGLFGAASSAGQLIFLPSLLQITSTLGWRSAIGVLAGSIALLVLPALLLMRNRPQDIGSLPVGETSAEAAAAIAPAPPIAMRQVVRTADFWLLAGSFFICGYTSNGLIGTHLIPHALEHGFTETAAATAMGIMGMLNIVGTLGSGWLTDRFDNRKLLATYYGLRALALIGLPFVIEFNGLLIFSIIYGLDWIATVPPTVNLTAQRYGKAALGTVFGWIFCAHMIGAGFAAYAGGKFHDELGDYRAVFFSAAVLGFIAIGLVLRIARRPTPQPQLA